MKSGIFKQIEQHLNSERLAAYRRDGADDKTTLARDLRNRVFHHERILHWQDLTRMLDQFSQTRTAGIRPWREKLTRL